MISWSFDDCNNKWKWCNDWLKITWTEGNSGLIITQKPNWYVCNRNPQGTDLRKQADPAWYLAAWPSGMDVGDKLNSRLEQELIFSASSGGRMWNTQPKWTHGSGRAKWYILCSKTLNAWISLSPCLCIANRAVSADEGFGLLWTHPTLFWIHRNYSKIQPEIQIKMLNDTQSYYRYHNFYKIQPFLYTFTQPFNTSTLWFFSIFACCGFPWVLSLVTICLSRERWPPCFLWFSLPLNNL